MTTSEARPPDLSSPDPTLADAGRRASCSPVTRPGASPPTLPSCGSCCGGTVEASVCPWPEHSFNLTICGCLSPSPMKHAWTNRALYPEYATATDEAIARKLQQTFFPNISYENFSEGFLHKNGSFGFPNFVIAELYLKRLDAYLRQGNWHAAKLDFKRAERGYNTPDAIDRWREIRPLANARVYVDMKTFNDERRQAVNLWIKEANGDTGPYSVEQLELNCGARQLRMISSASYDAAGNVTGSRRGSNWTSIAPETLGENLYDGACGAI
jgi:hypothetical protein